MIRRAPAFARAFAGQWRIVEMDQWEDLDLVEPAHITFTGKEDGELVFCAIEADLDVRYGSRDGSACAEFSWEGSDTILTPAAVAGRLSAPPAALSATFLSTKATIQGLSLNAVDSFGDPLGA